jgi:hypothetical protein
MKPPVNHNSFLTAIPRKTFPLPVKHLFRYYNFLTDPDFCNRYDISVLDYGCGKCKDINPPHWDNYDPHFAPDGLKENKRYSVILCTYVLCTLPSAEHEPILTDIQERLERTVGTAFISIRNDRPKQGWGVTKRGTYQGRCTKLKLPLFYKSASFRIHVLTRKTSLIPYHNYEL